jgi:hypothetical protein
MRLFICERIGKYKSKSLAALLAVFLPALAKNIVVWFITAWRTLQIEPKNKNNLIRGVKPGHHHHVDTATEEAVVIHNELGAAEEIPSL